MLKSSLSYSVLQNFFVGTLLTLRRLTTSTPRARRFLTSSVMLSWSGRNPRSHQPPPTTTSHPQESGRGATGTTSIHTAANTTTKQEDRQAYFLCIDFYEQLESYYSNLLHHGRFSSDLLFSDRSGFSELKSRHEPLYTKDRHNSI